MAELLVVEDDDTIGRTLQTSLHQHGHRVAWHRSARAALREARLHEFELALLDLGLPDLDGVELCRELRVVQPGCVLVILTARQEEMDVVVGLEAGADDYLTKPVRLTELHARIRAHLRRGAAPADNRAVLAVGPLQVDRAARRATVSGHEIPLRAKEFDLLARLAAEPGAAVSRTTLMADVWDAHWFGSTKTLDVHVAALRRKLEDAAGPAEAPAITTLRGHGYRLEQPQADRDPDG
ncbi:MULTISPECIES: response regulator transcription factor [Amycolatopsis]|uniref:Response regulator transcription factor n=1 Tax=Amycolatopsis echigonensis TaxID=2576905 RepID=A0A8E1VX91_9PSEU|nr:MULTISPECIES: response regulator transcription factor [Amycolatopsis]MBB2499948.1 response regulator transcription factor [Amycolatopsis echigonensis]MCG3751134.1 response regulator transcription factor [Amycolatopsis sp. Poz14]